MDSAQRKKMLTINILDILKQNTDEDHTLSQKDIVDILRRDYDMQVDRKAVKRGITDLIDPRSGFADNIHFTEVPRVHNGKEGAEENTIMTNFYYEREFTDAELRLLIDSLLFARNIPHKQCRDLIEKIEGLSNKYFYAKVSHICNLPENIPENKQLFYTLEQLDEAISQRKKVTFHYNNFGVDKKLHPRMTSENKAREYLINPYQMVATNGKYYLICNYDPYDSLGYYRIDRITDIQITEQRIKPIETLPGQEGGLNLPEHMAEHIYMYAGESERVTFWVQTQRIGDVVDWFGTDVRFKGEEGDGVLAEVKVNLQAMKCWAMQYADGVEVRSPKKLVDMICKSMRDALNKYEKSDKSV